jgi:peroxiredoxin (alkyl hydroperoxide reductase subunit C)
MDGVHLCFGFFAWLVTQPAPNFKATAVVNGNELKSVSLSDYAGKYVILVFYPLDFTFVCPTELIAFGDRIEEFRGLGCEVIGVSVDSEYTHLAWCKTPRTEGGLHPMNLPLVSDLDKNIARAYGVLLNDSVALRGLFLIDPKGLVRHATINDLPLGRSVDEALRVLQACQFTDVHGEVCPAGWKPGQGGMKADPEGSKAYFQALRN